ncbi:MAG: YdeI/OmpD-associated family protein [Flavobacteriales bacterium]|nr:YdeI/OmpD-associated family protein [Flavobacteriales bacterium]MCB9448001.1 YdeI/OmpD-associated family protein [Flavobacteriales bacterium]
MNATNPEVDAYLAEGCGRCPLGGTADCKVHTWPGELKLLRKIVLDCGLTEERKWGIPCYTFQQHNVAIVSAFKEYAALSFFKGALLQDEHKLLTMPGENTQSARVIRFTDVKQIAKLEPVLKAYIHEAIEVEKAGLKVDFKKEPEPIPEELQNKFAENPDLTTAFYALTPGRQRGYILHFSQPKQSKTRESRIEKCMPKIMAGKGFYD